MLDLEPELADHICDQPLRTIGKRHGISHEQARRLIRQQARDHITRIAGELLIASKTGELPTLLIPSLPGPEMDLPVAYLVWICDKLQEVGVELGFTYTAVENGLAIAFEDLGLRRN